MKYCGLGFGSFLFLPGRMKRKYNAFSFLLGWELLTPPPNTLTSCNLTGSHVPLWPTASIPCSGSRAVKWAKSPRGRLFEAPCLIFQERMGVLPSLPPAAIWTRDLGSVNNERPLAGGSATQLLCPVWVFSKACRSFSRPFLRPGWRRGTTSGVKRVLKNKGGAHCRGNSAAGYRFLPELGKEAGLCWSRAKLLGSPRAVGNDGASTRGLGVAIRVG